MSGITVKMKISDTDLFKDVLNVIKSFTEDERVPKEVRTEYEEKIISLTEIKS